MAAALASLSGNAALQEPGNTPRCELVPCHRRADVRMGRKDHPPGDATDHRHGVIRQVREQVQDRAVIESPVDGESAIGLQLYAGAGVDLRNEGHDVALADREQALEAIENVGVLSLLEHAPIEVCRTECLDRGGIGQGREATFVAELLEAGELALAT